MKYLINYNSPLFDGKSEDLIEGVRLADFSGIYNWAVFELIDKKGKIYYVWINKDEATIN